MTHASLEPRRGEAQSVHVENSPRKDPAMRLNLVSLRSYNSMCLEAMELCKMSLDLNSERGCGCRKHRDGGGDILIQKNVSLTFHSRLSVTYSLDSPGPHPAEAEVRGVGLVETKLEESRGEWR